MMEDRVTDCECTEAGFCKRHGLKKSRHEVLLCRRHPQYYQMWEEKRGSGQSPTRKPHVNKRATPSIGPGTELKTLLLRFRIVKSTGCGCGAKVRMMDENGPDWCKENLETIVDWLQEEATRRKLPFLRVGARQLVRYAIRRARMKLAMLEAASG